MATIKRFEDLEIWQEARNLSKIIIGICQTTALKNDFRLNSQIRASSGSIMDNIAEGFERGGNMEFKQFLSIAKGSAGETRSQLYRLFDHQYIDEETLNAPTLNCENLSGKISNFISYLQNNDYKGVKFK